MQEECRVRFYDRKKGFGVVDTTKGGAWFHAEDLDVAGIAVLRPDDLVSVEYEADPKGYRAKSIRLLAASDKLTDSLTARAAALLAWPSEEAQEDGRLMARAAVALRLARDRRKRGD